LPGIVLKVDYTITGKDLIIPVFGYAKSVGLEKFSDKTILLIKQRTMFFKLLKMVKRGLTGL